VWSDVVVEDDDSSREVVTCKKEFIKNMKLSKHPLCFIASIDDCVVVADEVGQIRFYDKDFKILFWGPLHDEIDSIVTISFDLTDSCGEEQQQESGFRIRDFFIGERRRCC